MAHHLGVPHIELDALYWGPNWQPVTLPNFRTRVEQATTENRWIVDGNYRTKARDIVWKRAQMVVWLDYPLPLVLWRLCQRSVANIYNRRDMWGTGSQETLEKQFLSSDSFLLWAIKTHNPRRRRLLQAMHGDAYSHIDFVRLPSPFHAQMWLNRLTPQAQPATWWSMERLNPIWGVK
ncbi:MAG: hypothetical protein R2911_41800 [Caldilineaceae bacterium]